MKVFVPRLTRNQHSGASSGCNYNRQVHRQVVMPSRRSLRVFGKENIKDPMKSLTRGMVLQSCIPAMPARRRWSSSSCRKASATKLPPLFLARTCSACFCAPRSPRRVARGGSASLEALPRAGPAWLGCMHGRNPSGPCLLLHAQVACWIIR